MYPGVQTRPKLLPWELMCILSMWRIIQQVKIASWRVWKKMIKRKGSQREGHLGLIEAPTCSISQKELCEHQWKVSLGKISVAEEGKDLWTTTVNEPISGAAKRDSECKIHRREKCLILPDDNGSQKTFDRADVLRLRHPLGWQLLICVYNCFLNFVKFPSSFPHLQCHITVHWVFFSVVGTFLSHVGTWCILSNDIHKTLPQYLISG